VGVAAAPASPASPSARAVASAAPAPAALEAPQPVLARAHTQASTPIRKGTEAAALLEQAKQAREQGRHGEAEALLLRVLAQHPDDSGARYQMALTLVRLHRLEEAHTQLALAKEANPESPLPWLLEGDVFLQEGQRPKAMRAWTRCLEIRSDFEGCSERLARWAQH
jgi:predicted negative regulator of RcsB-dependent stress response